MIDAMVRKLLELTRHTYTTERMERDIRAILTAGKEEQPKDTAKEATRQLDLMKARLEDFVSIDTHNNACEVLGGLIQSVSNRLVDLREQMSQSKVCPKCNAWIKDGGCACWFNGQTSNTPQELNNYDQVIMNLSNRLVNVESCLRRWQDKGDSFLFDKNGTPVKELKIGGYQTLALRIEEANKKIGFLEADRGHRLKLIEESLHKMWKELYDDDNNLANRVGELEGRTANQVVLGRDTWNGDKKERPVAVADLTKTNLTT